MVDQFQILPLDIKNETTVYPVKNQVVMGYDKLIHEWAKVQYSETYNCFFDYPYTGATYPIERMNIWQPLIEEEISEYQEPESECEHENRMLIDFETLYLECNNPENPVPDIISGTFSCMDCGETFNKQGLISWEE